MADFMEAAQKMSQQGQPMSQPEGYPYQGLAAPVGAAREMNLRERVMTHDQRIQVLEQENRELRLGLEKLVNHLVSQLGLVL